MNSETEREVAGVELAEELEHKFGPTTFTEGDRGLLLALGVDPTDEWLAHTNSIIGLSQGELTPDNSMLLERRLQTAADLLLWNQFGWLNRDHAMRPALSRFYNRSFRPRLVLPNVVRVMRLLHAGGLDVAQTLASGSNFRIITYGLDLLREKVGTYAALGMQGRPMARMLLRDHRAILQRTQLIESLARALRWNGNPKELVLRFPAITTAATNRLLLLAAIAADHAPPEARNMPLEDVLSAFMIPLEAHLAAADQGNYDLDKIRSWDKRIPSSERQAYALGLLASQKTRLSPRVRAMYKEYTGA